MEQLYIFFLLALAFLIIGAYLGIKIGTLLNNRKWDQRLPDIRKETTRRSRAALTGQVTEQLAPYLPGFRYRATEARFIGKPIDFIIFEGLDEKEVDNIVFVEVKSGNGQLSKVEKSLKMAIEEGRVSWEEYRI